MKRPAVFFDRDNTLIASDGYLGNPADARLLEGAADAVSKARALGYATVVFSNQSGVARGMFDEQAVHAVNSRIDDLLLDQSPTAVIDRHEFCPFHPEGTVEAYRQESDLRKPRPGMIFQAAEKLALDVSRSWVIGDAPRDVEAGHAAGCRTILFRDPRLPPSPAAKEPAVVQPDYVVGTLKEAMAIVERASQEETEVAEEPEDAPPPPAPRADAPAPVAAAAPAHERMAPPPKSPEAATAIAPPAAPAPAVSTPLMTLASPPIPSNDPPSPTVPETDLGTMVGHLETLCRQILAELRRGHEQPHAEFSVSKLLAGIVQVIVLAALFLAYLHRGDADLQTILVFALVLQAMTIALLIMGRQH